MGMRDQSVSSIERATEFLAPAQGRGPDAGAGIENNDLAVCAHFDATGVSAITHRCSVPGTGIEPRTPQNFTRGRRRFPIGHHFTCASDRSIRGKKRSIAPMQQLPRHRLKQIFIGARFERALVRSAA